MVVVDGYFQSIFGIKTNLLVQRTSLKNSAALPGSGGDLNDCIPSLTASVLNDGATAMVP